MGQIFCKHIKLNQIADALGVNPEVLAASKNIVGEDMHALFRVFRNHTTENLTQQGIFNLIYQILHFGMKNGNYTNIHWMKLKQLRMSWIE